MNLFVLIHFDKGLYFVREGKNSPFFVPVFAPRRRESSLISPNSLKSLAFISVVSLREKQKAIKHTLEIEKTNEGEKFSFICGIFIVCFQF